MEVLALAQVVLRRWWLVVLLGVVGVTCAYLAVVVLPKRYQSSVSLQLNPAGKSALLPYTGSNSDQVAPSAVATLAAVHVLKPDAVVFAEVVKRTLGIALFLTAGALVFRAQVQALGQRFAGRSQRVLSFAGATSAGSIPVTEERVSRPLPTMLIGLVIGTLVTLTSVGAGVIGVVALFFLYPLLPTRQIVGSDIAHAVPLTLVAGLGHVSLGNVNWSMLGMLLIGSLPAIHVGAAVAHRLPERALRIALATMLIGIGARLVLA